MHLRSVRSALTVAALLLPALAGAQNRALSQPAFASGSYSSTSTPERAVDGNTDGNYHNGSTFHSAEQQNGWWYVDLGASYDVSLIEFFNRTDCCESRLNEATIGVWSTVPFGPGTTNLTMAAPVWSAVFSGVSETPDPTQQFNFAPGGATGRYVGVIAAQSGDHFLQIAEVRVFGDPTGISAVPEPATVALVGGGLVALAGIARRRRA
jgi:hypothetical protein